MTSPWTRKISIALRNYSKTHSQSDSTFRLAFGADVYPHPGKIYLIDRAVDPQTGSVKVRLVFPNAKNLLRSGMSGTVRVLNDPSEKSILIPNKAITEQLGEYFVYVVNGDKVTQRKIKPGRQSGPISL